MATTACEHIIKSVSGGIGAIVFKNPKTKNAINSKMYVEIRKVLEEFSKDDKVVIATMTGHGEYYSSGTDLKDSPNADPDITHENSPVRLLIDTMIDFPKPLVALVNGPAIGIAVTSLALCDVVYASDKATFNTPFGVLGFCPEGCSSYLFPKIMGRAKAAEMLLFNRKFSAKEVCDIGLVGQVFPDLTFREETNRKLLEMAKFPPKGLSANKLLLSNHESEFLHKVNAKEMKHLYELFESEETINAVANFLFNKSKL